MSASSITVSRINGLDAKEFAAKTYSAAVECWATDFQPEKTCNVVASNGRDFRFFSVRRITRVDYECTMFIRNPGE